MGYKDSGVIKGPELTWSLMWLTRCYAFQFLGVWLTVRYRNQKDPSANPSAFLWMIWTDSQHYIIWGGSVLHYVSHVDQNQIYELDYLNSRGFKCNVCTMYSPYYPQKHYLINSSLEKVLYFGSGQTHFNWLSRMKYDNF